MLLKCFFCVILMCNMSACTTPSQLKMHDLKCSTPARYCNFPLATIILKAASYSLLLVSTRTSTQSHSGNNVFITQLIIKITIFSLAIGLKMSYFPLIRLPSCSRTVCYWIVCYWTVCYRTVQ